MSRFVAENNFLQKGRFIEYAILKMVAIQSTAWIAHPVGAAISR
jgi:hypothetical protein